MIAKQIKMKEK